MRLSARWRGRLLPWVFVGPALLLLTVYLAWPVVSTIIKSLTEGAGLANWEWALTTPANHQMYVNNILWLLVGVTGSVGFGLPDRGPDGSREVRVLRQDLRLPAAGDLTGGRLGDLAFRVRLASARTATVRVAQCHHGGSWPRADAVGTRRRTTGSARSRSSSSSSGCRPALPWSCSRQPSRACPPRSSRRLAWMARLSDRSSPRSSCP